MSKGLTLMEVLFIMAVTAVVSVLLLTGVKQQCATRRLARTGGCVSSMHCIGTGFTMYAGDNNMWPYGATFSGKVWQWDGTAGKCLGVIREQYVDATDFFECPANPGRPVYANGRFTSRLGYGYDAKDNENGTYVRNSTDPMRVVLADKDTGNHPDGSCVLFADMHVEYLKPGGKNIVGNPHLSGDTNIYQYGNVYTGKSPTSDPEPKGFTTDIDQNAAIRETY